VSSTPSERPRSPAVPELLGDHPDDTQIEVGHDHPASGPWTGIETAMASGRSRGASSGTKSLNPTTPAPAIGCGGRPHSGQATRYDAAAAANRNRQLGQPTWVMSDPFR